MADSNLYGLPTVQAALDSTSQLYAVTGSAGSFTDTRLPVAVLLNNTVLTGTPTISGYLTSVLAASTYLTQASASSTYLTQANATSTYLTITTAASTYATITNLALKAPLANPNFTGTATAQALTLTNLLTPSTTVGIKGTTLADNAQAGSVGESPTPTNLTGVALTSGLAANVSSISLTAGDWDISGTVTYTPTGATQTSAIVGISTTSATFLGTNTGSFNSATGISTTQGSSWSTPTYRLNVSTTTSVFLIGYCGYTAGTVAGAGFLHVRRVR